MTPQQWHADIKINEIIVKNCLQDQFPFLMPIKKIKQIGEGWDNRVFLINDEIIFRFPRRKIAVELVARENKVLEQLPKLLNVNVSIPIPKYQGQPTLEYPYPFQGYPFIKGMPGYQAQLNVHNRIASLPVIADFLKQLHSINEEHAGLIGAEMQIFNRAIINKTIANLEDRVSKIITQKICNINQNAFQQEIARAKEVALPIDNCLVHGDLDCRHLLFDNNQLTGIIDWGDTGINNKSIDLSIIWSFYPSSCHEDFFKIYGNVDPATWQYARFLALYSTFTHLLYGKDIQDVLLVNEAISTIKRINSNLLAE